MSDDPSKTGQDRQTVSSQEHEVNQLKAKFREEFPDVDTAALEEAIGEAKRSSKDRDAVESKVREILSTKKR